MRSKRRKRVCKKKKVPAKKRRSTRKSVSVSGQNVVKKLGINSVWRVRTDDEEITAKGHVKSSGWQRCTIVERSSTNVKVKYFNEPEPIEYNIDDFLTNAQSAPTHVIDVTKKAASTFQLEQAKFTPQERGDILPLQLRHVAQPSKWKKSACF